MRQRPSARLLLLDEEGHVLLFRFVFKTGALAGEEFWATPGGALEEGETFAEAARRELIEETGFEIGTFDAPIAEKEFVLTMSDGEEVMAHEQFFMVRVSRRELSDHGWTQLEKEVMVEHRWWSPADLVATKELVYPEDLHRLISAI